MASTSTIYLHKLPTIYHVYSEIISMRKFLSKHSDYPHKSFATYDVHYYYYMQLLISVGRMNCPNSITGVGVQ